jgi:hypothetical protein
MYTVGMGLRLNDYSAFYLLTAARRTSNPTKTVVFNGKTFFSYNSNILSTQTSCIIATEYIAESFVLIQVVQILTKQRTKSSNEGVS